MSKPTTEEVKAEIEKLKALKDKVRPRTLFGDDNRAAVQAQIDALEDPTGEVDYGTEHEADNYNDAKEWLRRGDTGDGTPSSGWANLVTE